MPKSVLVYFWTQATPKRFRHWCRNLFRIGIRPKQPETICFRQCAGPSRATDRPTQPKADFVADTTIWLGQFQANADQDRFRHCCGHICWVIFRPTLPSRDLHHFGSTLPRTIFDTFVEICSGLRFGRSNPKQISTVMSTSMLDYV